MDDALDSGSIVFRNRNDVYKLINDAPRTPRRNKMIRLVALSSLLVDGWDSGGLGTGVPSLTKEFGLTGTQIGLLTAAIGVGALLAAIGGGYLVDRLGRLRMFTLDLIVFVVSAIIGAISPVWWLVLISRFLMGVGIGLDIPAAMSVVAEHSTAKSKRKYLNQNMLFFYYSIFASYILSYILVRAGFNSSLWRWQLAASGVLALIVIVVRISVAEESAVWLASRGQLRAAADIIERTFKVHVTVERDTVAPTQAVPLIAYFRGRYLPRTILATSINFLGAGVSYFAVGFYAPVILSRAIGDPAMAMLGSSGIAAAGILGGALGSGAANRLGLRRQTIIGFAIQLPVLILIGTGQLQGWLPIAIGIVLLAIFQAAMTWGPGQTGVSIGALSYPSAMRGRGVGITYGVGRGGTIVGLYLFPVLLGSIGLGSTLLCIALAPFFALLICLAIKWEPAGDTAEAEDVQLKEAPERGGSRHSLGDLKASQVAEDKELS